MREVPEALAGHLAGRITSLCRCWRLTRRDGVVLGFTDHDEAILFGGTRFEAASGLDGSESEGEIGLGTGTQEVTGALSSMAIREEDIGRGRFDGARVETFLVNWQAPEERLRIDVATLGEVKRDGTAFAAELRGIEAELDRRRGRLYRRRCDAALGDERCQADLSSARLKRAGTVVRVEGGAVVAEGMAGVEGELFAQGRLQFVGGALAGLAFDVAGVRGAEGTVRIALMEPPPDGAVAGDAVELRAGCDKSYATCRARFSNGLNFRGFPHIPGNDAAFAFAKSDGRHDGSPVVP